MQTCSACKQHKEITEFCKNKNSLNGIHYRCKQCQKVNWNNFVKAHPNYTKKYRSENKEKVLTREKNWRKVNAHKLKAYKLKGRYGISLEEFNNLLINQKNECKICLKKCKILHVDHCHKTGKIRGLLCVNCNQGIGSLKEDTNIMKNAIKYIETNYE